MKWFFVVLSCDTAYDEHEPLFAELRVQHAKMIQDNVWLVKTKYKVRSQEVFDNFKQHLKPSDRLLVIESVDSSWYNLIWDPLSQVS